MRFPGPEFRAEHIVQVASPAGPLRDVFAPLLRVPPRPIVVELALVKEEQHLSMLQAELVPDHVRFDTKNPCPDHELVWLGLGKRDLRRVFTNYRKHLPREWIEMLEWAHWVALSLLPPEMPTLRHAFEALIEIEPQLHVDSYHPNRDHVVHQIADACMAAALFERCTPNFDDADWNVLCDLIPSARQWDPSLRERVTVAGLALAGLTHDVGYIRYIGSTARERLATVFGVPTPPTNVGAWDIARVFGKSLLEAMLVDHSYRPDGIVVDLYQAAWKRQDHGPLSAFVLSSVARSLRLEGRSIPEIEAILQIAAAAAFLHELHPNKKKREDAPNVVKVARERIARFTWPGLFRIVDDLQCWFRPSLHPIAAETPTIGIDLGAQGCRIDGSTLQLLAGKTGVGKSESEDLRYLMNYGGLKRVFDALQIERVEFTP